MSTSAFSALLTVKESLVFTAYKAPGGGEVEAVEGTIGLQASRKILLPRSRIEPRLLNLPVHNIVTIPTELTRLSNFGVHSKTVRN